MFVEGHEGYSISARVRYSRDLHHDDRSNANRLAARELIGERRKFGSARQHCVSNTVETHNSRWTFERAEHQDDATVLAQVGDRLYPTARLVQVGRRSRA